MQPSKVATGLDGRRRVVELDISLVAAFLVCVLVGCDLAKDTPPVAPNVVLVVLDTLRPDHLGCYGYSRDTSPNLDALAKEFFIFEQAQSAAPWTAPSLISLMTSLYPDVHQIRQAPNPGRVSPLIDTLAEVLGRRGYRTAAFTEGGYASAEFGLEQGFEHFTVSEREYHLSEVAPRPVRQLAANLDGATAWLEENHDGPFFLLLHTYEPHAPLDAPEKFVRRYRPGFDTDASFRAARRAIQGWNEAREIDLEGIEAIRNALLRTQGAGLPAIEDVEGISARATQLNVAFQAGEWGSSPESLALLRDLYDAEVRYADSELARLWSKLSALGVEDDTIVVVVSDHGEALGERGQIGHGRWLFEEVLNVVLMIRVPDEGFEPRRVPYLVRLVDVMPTVLELAGVPLEGLVLQGRSLVPILRWEEKGRISFSHASTRGAGRSSSHSVRTRRWRLIVDDVGGKTRLFDLDADPGELVNVARERPDVTWRLRKLLAKQAARDTALRRQLDAPPEIAEIEQATLEQLRGLGYLEND